MDIDISDAPHTKEVVLDGLRQALQARVGTIWNNVTLAGEPATDPRFKEGILKAIKYYEQAWNAINDTLPNDE